MEVTDRIALRIEQLIADASRLGESNQYGYALHIPECCGWITAAHHVVQLACPSETNAYRRAVDGFAARSTSGSIVHETVAAIRHVLIRLNDDINEGLLASLVNQAHAEVFDDFLDTAKEYQRRDRKNEAGTIAGVVFEDSLRRLCDKHGVPQKGESLDELISLLTKKQVLSGTKGKRARVSAHVRTKATHAQWDEFDSSDVSATIELASELIRLLEA